MNHPDWKLLAEKAALYLYPRRCPFCGAVLGRDAVQGTVCPACFEAADKRLVHLPPRLPETEHAFYALNSAVAACGFNDQLHSCAICATRPQQLSKVSSVASMSAIFSTKMWWSMRAVCAASV